MSSQIPPPPPDDSADPKEPVAAATKPKKPWSKPTFVVLEERTMSRVRGGPAPQASENAHYYQDS